MLVSIITTCYNAAGCIEKTIKSVLAQSFTDFEYIIMDGGSKDATVAIAEGYCQAFADRGISYSIFSEKDRGIYDGMNHGVEHAKGTFINFMNADDVFYDENVLGSIFTEAAMDKKPDVIYGDAGELEYGQVYLFVKNFDGIKNRMPFSHQSVFAKRELLERFPFDTGYRIAADYDFLMNCCDAGAKFVDSGVIVCLVSKDGVSSRELYNTFMETEKMLNSHGVYRYQGMALKKKLFFLRIRQFGMDYLPDFIKNIIRNLQRKARGQDKKL